MHGYISSSLSKGDDTIQLIKTDVVVIDVGKLTKQRNHGYNLPCIYYCMYYSNDCGERQTFNNITNHA